MGKFMDENIVEKKSIDLDGIVEALGRDIRIYFRIGIACWVLWFLLAFMMPSWRQPFSIGYVIFAWSMFLGPLLPLLYFHVVILYKVRWYCSLRNKKKFIMVLYLIITLIFPFGALIVPGLLRREYKRSS